jgi:lipocalin
MKTFSMLFIAATAAAIETVSVTLEKYEGRWFQM